MHVWKSLHNVSEKSNDVICESTDTKITRKLGEIRQISENLKDFIFLRDPAKDYYRLYPLMEKENLLLIQSKYILQLRSLIFKVDELISKHDNVRHIQKLLESENARLGKITNRISETRDYVLNNTNVEIPAD